MGGIKQILEVDNLVSSPARVNRKTGTLLVSREHFKNMDPNYRYFVLLHEEAHVLFDTDDEMMCDEYAMRKMIKKGYPLSEILKSLTRVLSYNKDSHYGRTLNIFNKLREYDYHVNGNDKVLTSLNFSQMNTPGYNIDDIYTSQFEGDTSDFLGLGKKAAARREERHDAKMEKKAAKTDLKKAKAESIRSGEMSPEGGLGKFLGSAAGIAGKFLGIQEPQPENDNPEPEKKDYTWLYILIAIIVIAIIAYFVFFRKKSKK
jgi:hypothetical protein